MTNQQIQEKIDNIKIIIADKERDFKIYQEKAQTLAIELDSLESAVESLEAELKTTSK